MFVLFVAIVGLYTHSVVQAVSYMRVGWRWWQSLEHGRAQHPFGIGMNANTNPGANAFSMPPGTWPADSDGGSFGNTLDVRRECIRRERSRRRQDGLVDD